MLNNKSFYPTPGRLIRQMVEKIQGNPQTILEPSAGKGDIIDYIKDDNNHYLQYSNISAIESDPELQATLIGKGYKLIDTDFLSYAGPDQFDLIIANPPFDEGDKHLLKAIQIMYSGEIIFLLNAETLRNPCTNIRKELVRQLKDLNADITPIGQVFKESERPTSVEVALVYINIERKIEDDLFAGCDDEEREFDGVIEQEYEVSTGKTVEELVAEYNQTVKVGTDTIMAYYKNYPKIWHYVGLNRKPDDFLRNSDNITLLVKGNVNDLVQKARHNYWRRVLNIQEVNSRMTANKQAEFETLIARRSHMDFTENNIRQFIINLIGGFEQTLTDAVLEVFDKFTQKFAYDESIHCKNTHYFNGWKTNDAFKVNKTVILPLYGGYGKGPFINEYSGEWEMYYDVPRQTKDFDIVMNYFDGMHSGYCSIGDALSASLKKQKSKNIYSTYFTITVYKKGTIHLTFNDEDILRRFNVVACKGKGWLPGHYGTRAYNELTYEEQGVVDSFEGEKSYNKNLNQPLFAQKNLLQIAV